MDAVTYPETKVADFVNRYFVPARIDFKDNPDVAAKFGVMWSPTILFIDPVDGIVHHQFTGYLPPDAYLAETHIGLGKIAFDHNKFEEAAGWFQKAVEEFPETEAAPQAQYYLGVAQYKRTGRPDGLKEAWKVLLKRYPKSSWATKASFIEDKE